MNAKMVVLNVAMIISGIVISNDLVIVDMGIAMFYVNTCIIGVLCKRLNIDWNQCLIYVAPICEELIRLTALLIVGPILTWTFTSILVVAESLHSYEETWRLNKLLREKIIGVLIFTVLNVLRGGMHLSAAWLITTSPWMVFAAIAIHVFWNMIAVEFKKASDKFACRQDDYILEA
jgi:hypothetical protein